MMLTGKNAIIYGAGGSIGGAVARAFAREGAKVHLTGRTREPLDRLAAEIREAGGAAETALVDAMDPARVGEHARSVFEADGRLDISMSVVGIDDVQGTPLTEMAWEDFSAPVVNALRSTFVTATAAARLMIGQGSGVILTFGGYGPPTAGLGGLQVAFQTQDSLRSVLAAELGPHGIRVVTLQTGGITETLPADFEHAAAVTEAIDGATLLGRAATLADVGNVAAFAASDLASSITAAALNITCGSVADH
ncbi:SDR family NAD(P)-dependent oxidoreductase [Actinocorallia longicatena]|uniref:SDR family oxidoreductase n=1 Tax=Actinocorallia longicatena TaxID=111803 RepID=A0ABP6Q9R9_9ACTN